jgi:hypothetical protein
VYRKTQLVTAAPVAVDIHEPFDIEAYFSSEFAFDLVFVLDDVTNRDALVFAQILDSRAFVNARFFANLPRRRPADTEDISQANDDPLLVWDINTCYTRHLNSLLVYRLGEIGDSPTMGLRRFDATFVPATAITPAKTTWAATTARNKSTLPLLVPLVLADHPNDALAPNDLALRTNFSD